MSSSPRNALLGHTGFVGASLARQAAFAASYHSATIGQLAGTSYDSVYCAAAPGQKWRANRDPAHDRAAIDLLTGHLATLRCQTFVLISTVDVFADPCGVDETSAVDAAALQPYGRHRRMLEDFVADHFEHRLIVRLPGLVGPGLRKNVLFDLHNGHQCDAIDGRAAFQFYPMVNLWSDIQTALAAGLDLVHLCAEPLGVAELARQAFGRTLGPAPDGPAPRYDMRSLHAPLFGGAGHYTYSARESLLAIRAYAQSEPGGCAPAQAA